jgi:hypothetical protein
MNSQALRGIVEVFIYKETAASENFGSRSLPITLLLTTKLTLPLFLQRVCQRLKIKTIFSPFPEPDP